MMFCASFGLIGVIVFVVFMRGYSGVRKAVTGYGPYEGPSGDGRDQRESTPTGLSTSRSLNEPDEPVHDHEHTRRVVQNLYGWGSAANVRAEEGERPHTSRSSLEESAASDYDV